MGWGRGTKDTLECVCLGEGGGGGGGGGVACTYKGSVGISEQGVIWSSY